ncbi:MAG: ribosome biogenesis GTPase YlqF [Oscillospiraceae bacterium]|nr:ribosome biogenesis GTPase YlqF [Oscillospiraceae bacterium]
MADIQWFPGHMKKAERMMQDSLKLVDVICEVVDARIPAASRNPDLDEIIAGRKPRLLILNRSDQADPNVTAQWRNYYKTQGTPFLECDARSGRGVKELPKALRAIREKNGPLRAMVVGVPNVGKSTFINKVSGRKTAAVSDRPGVTRGKQWITVDNQLELLDTPGILWPKFVDQATGERLAFTGAVKDDVLDREELAAKLLVLLRTEYPAALTTRYKIDPDPEAQGWELLEACARKRGFLMAGGEVNTERMAAILLDEFRGGKLGRISLERPR